MKSLVESVYSKLNMVNQFVDSDADILAILNGAYEEVGFTGLGANNEDALNEISQWLELQNQKMLKTSMCSAGIRRSPMAGRKSTLQP